MIRRKTRDDIDTLRVAASNLHQMVSIRDVIERYIGAEVRRNRIPCPLHRGEDYNFCFSQDMFYCFVCGKGGDAITLVMELFSLGFASAVRKIDTDFSLGLMPNNKLTVADRLAIRQKANNLRWKKLLKDMGEENKAAEFIAWINMRNTILKGTKIRAAGKGCSPGDFCFDDDFTAWLHDAPTMALYADQMALAIGGD